VTLTYGNGTLKEVHEATENLLRELNINDIEIFSGEKGGKFLAEEVKKHRGEVTILATGSMTNLYTAYKYDVSFYENLKEICIMGGVVEPLIINGTEVNELNFSADHEVAYNGAVL
jgi:inosine-uridine nucleoside N-ribohydrolase